MKSPKIGKRFEVGFFFYSRGSLPASSEPPNRWRLKETFARWRKHSTAPRGLLSGGEAATWLITEGQAQPPHQVPGNRGGERFRFTGLHVRRVIWSL